MWGLHHETWFSHETLVLWALSGDARVTACPIALTEPPEHQGPLSVSTSLMWDVTAT